MSALAAGLIAATAFAAPASATVITSLSGGTAVAVSALNLFTAGPVTVSPGITYTSTSSGSVMGWTRGYGFGTNGDWSGIPMIGLNEGTGSFDLRFDNPISAFLGELNWTAGAGGDATIAAYNSANVLLETLTLENGANVVAPGYWGFSRGTSDIAAIRFTNEYIGVRNIVVQPGAAQAAVPEPATWALMLIGFGFVGAAMRSARRRQTRVRFAF